LIAPNVGVEGDGNEFDFEFEVKEPERRERINSSAFREYDFQQVVTPCPIICQNFTPTFLNTPHAMSYMCSFGKFDKNDNLFLKNS
jgi:hypothetical protein